jgi:hypothetical protein
MIKDLSKSLIAAVAAINEKTRTDFATEQKTLIEKSTVAKQLGKMKPAKQGHADPAAVKGAEKMAEAAEGTTPKTAKEKKLAAMSGDPNKITMGDVLKGRGVKKEEAEQEGSAIEEKHMGFAKLAAQKGPALAAWIGRKKYGKEKFQAAAAAGRKLKEEAEEVDEATMNKTTGMSSKPDSSHPFSPNYKSQMATKPGEKAGFDSKKVSTGTVYTRKPVKEATDTPGNSTHQCAIHVKSEQFGEGKTLFSQHAEPDAEGQIAWYDVMFEHGIEKRVPVEQLEILVSESHMNHKKKAK